MKYIYLFTLTLICVFNSSANTFTVTSSADGTTSDGVSLRWALAEAQNHSGSDSITFNIPGPAPHHILLSFTTLPQLTGTGGLGTIIDGTTQPGNGYSGISPKIVIDGNNSVTDGFVIGAANCEIYGLHLTRFMTSGIFMSYGGNNFIIGAPGKGNLFNNMPNAAGGIEVGNVVGGTIQGNKIGTDTTGTVARGLYTGIYISGSSNQILIGGNGAGEGNLVSACFMNIYVEVANSVIIKGNVIGPGINGNKIPGANSSNGIYLLVADHCIIGGQQAGEGNIIAFNEDSSSHTGAGIEMTGSFNLISRNSIYCNGSWEGIQLIAGNLENGNNPIAAPVIWFANSIGAYGYAPVNSEVELFYNHTGCTHTPHGCSGKTYITTVTADGFGNWSYAGTLTAGLDLTATAINPLNNNTSQFANCTEITLYTGTNDFSGDNAFTLYPNPVGNELSVENPEYGIKELTIYNTLGEVLKSEKGNMERKLAIDIQGFYAGVYFIRLITENGNRIAKFIKQ